MNAVLRVSKEYEYVRRRQAVPLKWLLIRRTARQTSWVCPMANINVQKVYNVVAWRRTQVPAPLIPGPNLVKMEEKGEPCDLGARH